MQYKQVWRNDKIQNSVSIKGYVGATMCCCWVFFFSILSPWASLLHVILICPFQTALPNSSLHVPAPSNDSARVLIFLALGLVLLSSFG